jgi:DNA-binding SARP family transcriptional activator
MLSARKAWALLAYLALPPGQMHPRDKLTALLWGGVPDPQARASLRQALLTLRRALGDGAELLVQEGEGIALDPRHVEVDAVRLEQGHRAADEGGLASAVALYRGDLLAGLALDESPFEEWLVAEREHFRELALEGLARLLARQRAAGALEVGVGTALRLLAIDPLQESVQRTLMRLYAALGRRGDALRQYRECVAVLQRELAAEPEAETRQLYQEILRDRLAGPFRTDRGQAAAVPSDVSRPELATLGLGLAEVPLVARTVELDQLREALGAAWAGHAQLFLVRGEAGIGKSRLIAELAGDAERRGGRAFLGQSYESDQALPFGPWIDLLRTAVAELGPELGGLAAAWRVELARLLPELADATAPPPEAPAHHRRLFEAVAALIRNLARSRPVLLVLEDLHWADEPSLRLLASLGRRLADAPVLVVASVRDEDLADAPERARLLDVVTEPVATVTLGPLSRSDTATLVAALGRRGADTAAVSQLADRVWAVSEGHPLMVVEATRVYGTEPDDQAARPALPDQIHDLVARRLHRVSEPGRAVLAAAAVAGRQVDFPVLARAAALGEPEAAAAVEELVRRRLLREAGEGFAFAHERVREVVYAGLLVPRRRLLHRRVAEALEAHAAGRIEPHALALGLHFQAAEIWDKAVLYLREAGAQAMTRGAYREAAASLEQALAAVEHLAGGPEAAQSALELRLRLRNALLPLGDHARMLDNLREAEALAERLDDQRRLGWILSYSALDVWRHGEAARAIGLAERVLAIGGALGDLGLRVIAGIRLGQAYHGLGRYAEAVEALQATVRSLPGDLSRETYGLSAPPAVIARTWLAWCLAERGEFAEGERHAEEGLAIAEQLGQPYPLVAACFGLGLVRLCRGDLADAIRVLERGLALCQDREIPVFFAWTASSLALARTLAGQLERGRPLLEAPLEPDILAKAAQQAFPFLWLGEAHLLAGRLPEADERARQALALAETRRERGHEAHALRLQAEIAARREPADAALAERLYRRAIAVAEELGMPPLVARCRLGLGLLYARAGQRERAEVELAAARHLFSRMAMEFWLTRAERARDGSP